MKKHITWLTLGVLIVLAISFFPNREKLPVYPNELKMLNVQVDGAVKKPGYYLLPDGSLLFDLIELAGGLKENADTKGINYLEPIVKSNYQIPYIIDSNEKVVPTYNLNTISFQELMMIPNITETRALNILLYRQEYNLFQSIDELLLVKGIGDATFEKIKDYFII